MCIVVTLRRTEWIGTPSAERGQGIVEYALVALLVIVALTIVGYVVYSNLTSPFAS